jgi:hypothetical protein
MGVVRRARMARVCLARERRACGERGEFGASLCPGLYGEGWQAHSVRRESCDSPSSPEPAAGLFGGLVGRGASSEPRVPGLVRRGLAGALRAQREL